MKTKILPELFQHINHWSYSLFRVTTPDNLLGKSKNITQEYENVLKVSIVLLIGKREGKIIAIPYNNHRMENKINSISNESLWLYGEIKHPDNFIQTKWEYFNVSTGDSYKCNACRGKGYFPCTNCNGSGWYIDTNREQKRCHSCSGGKKKCKRCDGYGDLENILNIKTRYEVFNHHIYSSTGDIPKDIINRSKLSGSISYFELFNFPDETRDLLIGGINENDYLVLLNLIMEAIQTRIVEMIMQPDKNIDFYFNALTKLFSRLPNIAKENKVLQHEIYPVRIQIKIEDIPIYKISYTFEDMPYCMWVFGNEKKIFTRTKPNKFTWKLAFFIILFLLVGSIFGCLLCLLLFLTMA